MSDSEEHVQLIIKGIDQGATKLNKDVTDGLKGIESQAGKTTTGIGRIKASLDGLGSWIKAGIGIGIGEGLFGIVERGLEALPRAFFGAVDAGQSWLETVKEIERATGMSAQQSSEWAAVMERVGVPVGDVNRILSQLGHNLLENEDLFKRAGIATRDSSGQFLDAYTILQNIRRVMSANGQSIQNAGLAQELLARGGYKWLEVLQLTDEQWKEIAGDAARSGQVVTEQQTRQAEELSRLQDRVQGAIQGLQTAIFSGVVPVLSQFVDQFSNWIEDHMQQIAQFVSNVASFIAGVLGGLLGIDFAAKSSAAVIEDHANAVSKGAMSFADWAKNAAAAKNADDAFTTGLNAQIKAIDAQIKAIQHRSDAEHAAQERARLDQALASAQAQLADLKGNAPYTEGLSNSEAVLARQKHAQDIIDAEKAVSDAKSGINQFEADESAQAAINRLQVKKQALQEEIAAHKKAVEAKAAYDQYLVGVNRTQDSTIKQLATDMYAGITAQAKSWRDNGVKFAGDLKGAIGGILDVLLGPEETLQGPNINGSAGITTRSGGLVGALGGLGGMMDKIKTVILAGIAIIVAKVTIDLAGALLGIAGGIVSLVKVVGGALADLGGAILGLLGPIGTLGVAIGGLVNGDSPQDGPAHNGSGQWIIDYARKQPANQVYDFAMVGTYDGHTLHEGMTWGQVIAALIAAGYGHSEGGWVGLDGPELGVYGEEGPEFVRRHGTGTGDPGPASRPAQLAPVIIRLEIGGRALIDYIDERLQIRADNAPVGISAFRGASG